MYNKRLFISLILSGMMTVSLLFVDGFSQFNNFTTPPLILKANDGTTVIIQRDAYGVPHIEGETKVGMFYGQGFAAAQDRLYQMEINRRVAEGKISEIAGPEYLPLDQGTRRELYTVQERVELFNTLQQTYREMITAYTAGVNAYIDSMTVNPVMYKPFEFLAFEMERWTELKTVAIIQKYIRGFGKFGGDELSRLVELQVNGQERFDQKRPINDKKAPTTIPEVEIGPVPQIDHFTYSGMKVRQEVVNNLNLNRNRVIDLERNLGIPEKFGSYAVLVNGNKSFTSNAMLLGCPQMGEPEQHSANVVHEVEIQCPGFHVGGMTIAGMPMVIIGRNDYHAWTMTSGASDNCDLYIDSTMNAEYSSYYHNGEWLNFDVITDTIYVLGEPTFFTHYRTVHGPVMGDDLPNNQVYSLKMTFWKKELDMIEAFYAISIADNIHAFEDGVFLIPVSFNVFYAGMDNNIGFWHAGFYQDRTDGVDPRLPHKGDGTEEWKGFINFVDLPNAENPPQGFFVNWNNKPVSWWNNGDNMSWIKDSYVYNRVNAIDNFVRSTGYFSFDDLITVPNNIKSHGSYQQAIELTQSTSNQMNIVPPGQSAFVNITGLPSVHTWDQWQLHCNWEFKNMEFENTTKSESKDKDFIVKESFQLMQNYPNPFNPETNIKFVLPKTGLVKITMYDVAGRELRILLNEQLQPGVYERKYNFSGFSSGVYFYKIETKEFSQVKKMILIK